jgi:HEAT repeat protein
MTSESRMVVRRARAVFAAAAFAALSCLAPSCAKSASEWRAELSDDDPYVRAMAAIGFCSESPDRAIEAFPELIELLLSQDTSVRTAARRVLCDVSRHDPATVLGVALHTPNLDSDVHKVLNSAVAWAGAKAVGPIVTAMHDPAGANPRLLASMLAEIGEPALDALCDLFEHDPTPIVRAAAAFALGELGPRAERALPLLLASANRDEVVIARVAIESIARIDTSTRRSLPLLRASLSRPEKYMREAASAALVRLYLSRAALHPEERVAAVGEIVGCGDEGWWPLVRALDENDPAARRLAEQCLMLAVAKIELEHALRPVATSGAVDTKVLQTQPSVQAITGRDVSDTPLPRGLAVLALARGGERSLPYFALVVYALTDAAPSVRWCAALALLSIAVDSSRVLADHGPWSFGR